MTGVVPNIAGRLLAARSYTQGVFLSLTITGSELCSDILVSRELGSLLVS